MVPDRKPRGDWHLIIAFGIAILFALLLAILLNPKEPNLTGDSGYQEERSEYYPGGSDCHPFQIGRLAYRERLEKAIACENAAEQHRLDTNDLIQQRRAANAAEASAVFAFQQTRIVNWGLPLGLITMAAAIAAAHYARMAGHAARDTVSVTRRVGRDQSRAYLHAESALLFWQSPESPTPRVLISIANSGATPARWFECRSGGITVERETIEGCDPPAAFWDITISDKPRRWGTIGSGGNRSIDGINREVSSKFTEFYHRRGKTTFHVAGVIRYETFFGEVFETDFWFVGRSLGKFSRGDGDVEVPQKLQHSVGSIRAYQFVGMAAAQED